jgi:hypothetical protein
MPKISKNQWIAISVVSFLIATTILAGRDWLIHHDLYSYGLQANWTWINWDWTIYFLELQAVAVVCVLIARSHRLSLLILFEAFILSSTQDLLFFGVWGQGAFPTTSWDWMLWAKIFGEWTTPMQFALSAIALSVGALVAYALPRKVNGVKVP